MEQESINCRPMVAENILWVIIQYIFPIPTGSETRVRLPVRARAHPHVQDNVLELLSSDTTCGMIVRVPTA